MSQFAVNLVRRGAGLPPVTPVEPPYTPYFPLEPVGGGAEPEHPPEVAPPAEEPESTLVEEPAIDPTPASEPAPREIPIETTMNRQEAPEPAPAAEIRPPEPRALLEPRWEPPSAEPKRLEAAPGEVREMEVEREVTRIQTVEVPPVAAVTIVRPRQSPAHVAPVLRPRLETLAAPVAVPEPAGPPPAPVVEPAEGGREAMPVAKLAAALAGPPTPPSEQPVQVRIGTVEVRVTAPPAAPAPVPAPAAQGFGPYLSKRRYQF